MMENLLAINLYQKFDPKKELITNNPRGDEQAPVMALASRDRITISKLPRCIFPTRRDDDVYFP